MLLGIACYSYGRTFWRYCNSEAKKRLQGSQDDDGASSATAAKLTSQALADIIRWIDARLGDPWDLLGPIGGCLQEGS